MLSTKVLLSYLRSEVDLDLSMASAMAAPLARMRFLRWRKAGPRISVSRLESRRRGFRRGKVCCAVQAEEGGGYSSEERPPPSFASLN